MNVVKAKRIDFNKVKTVDDVKQILKAMNMVFYDDGFVPEFEHVRHYLVDKEEELKRIRELQRDVDSETWRNKPPML